jgi:hypothetical protein
MRYDIPLNWIEDAEARRVSRVHVFDRPDRQSGEPAVSDQIHSWIDGVKARIAIQRVQFGSLKRTR